MVSIDRLVERNGCINQDWIKIYLDAYGYKPVLEINLTPSKINLPNNESILLEEQLESYENFIVYHDGGQNYFVMESILSKKLNVKDELKRSLLESKIHFMHYKTDKSKAEALQLIEGTIKDNVRYRKSDELEDFNNLAYQIGGSGALVSLPIAAFLGPAGLIIGGAVLVASAALLIGTSVKYLYENVKKNGVVNRANKFVGESGECYLQYNAFDMLVESDVR
jgi:hypothetical protein